MKSITIKEIAKKANVSIGTVDRALHNRGKVNAETAARIKQICDEFGYESNVVGRAMAMQRKERIVAVVINARNRKTLPGQLRTTMSILNFLISMRIRFLR